MGTWCPDTQPSTPCHKDLASEQLAITMDINSKSEFIYFMQRACEDQSNDCYIELYNILLRAFVCADCDFDGQVSEDEFGGMINAAAALAKKWETLPLRATRRSTGSAGSASRLRTPTAMGRCLATSCDDDRDLDGEPEEARLAGSFPNPRGEGCLL